MDVTTGSHGQQERLGFEGKSYDQTIGAQVEHHTQPLAHEEVKAQGTLSPQAQEGG